MARKKESVLGLAPVTQNLSNSSVVSYGNQNVTTDDERRIISEYRKQNLVIDGGREKSKFAISQIAEIYQHGVTTFDNSTEFITKLNNRPRSKDHQAYMDEFCDRSVQMLARHIFGVVEVGATNIGVEVHRSLYPVFEPPVLEKPKSLLQRILG